MLMVNTERTLMLMLSITIITVMWGDKPQNRLLSILIPAVARPVKKSTIVLNS